MLAMVSRAEQERPVDLSGLSPTALADVMLLEVLARAQGTLVLEPGPEGRHCMSFDSGGRSFTLGEVDAEVAEAALLRMALIADVGMEAPQLGRIRLHLASHQGSHNDAPAEVLMALRATAGGLAVELHALAGVHSPEAVATVAGIEGVPVPRPEHVKYQVLGELGRGGMGIVYLARHVQLDKEVALKVLSPHMASRRGLAAQFVVEARAACRARHPNIVDVTDFGRLADGRDYLVMERIDWPTLTDRLAVGRLPAQRALTVALGVARGLSAAHAQGVVHRDLKPANVFVSDSDQVKIGDFGLAQTSGVDGEVEPLDGVLFGTVPYMAPEHVGGFVVDHRADLYSFGCMLYELLMGVTPYASDNSMEVLESHRSAPIPTLAIPELRCLARVDELYRSLLAKDPRDRMASFEDVVAALEACLGDVA